MPDTTASTPPISAQSTALRALLRLTEQHPELPGAYIVSSSTYPHCIDVQLDNPSALEAWREAVDVPTDAVHTKSLGEKTELEISANVGGATICVYAIFTPAAQQPREAA
jgi:hypothetical protein